MAKDVYLQWVRHQDEDYVRLSDLVQLLDAAVELKQNLQGVKVFLLESNLRALSQR